MRARSPPLAGRRALWLAARAGSGDAKAAALPRPAGRSRLGGVLRGAAPLPHDTRAADRGLRRAQTELARGRRLPLPRGEPARRPAHSPAVSLSDPRGARAGRVGRRGSRRTRGSGRGVGTSPERVLACRGRSRRATGERAGELPPARAGEPLELVRVPRRDERFTRLWDSRGRLPYDERPPKRSTGACSTSA